MFSAGVVSQPANGPRCLHLVLIGTRHLRLVGRTWYRQPLFSAKPLPKLHAEGGIALMRRGQEPHSSAPVWRCFFASECGKDV